MCVQSPATLCDPMYVAHQPPLSMEFFRQYWRGLPFSTPQDLSPPGVPTRVSCTGRRVTDWQKKGGGKERGEDCIFSRCLNIPVISAFYSIINTSVPIPRIDANISKSKDQVDVPDKPRLLNWSFAVTLTHSAASKFLLRSAREVQRGFQSCFLRPLHLSYFTAYKENWHCPPRADRTDLANAHDSAWLTVNARFTWAESHYLLVPLNFF